MEHGLVLQNRYLLKKVIGKGGEGCVYLAYDLKLEKYWAVKEINRTGREEQILKELNHPAFPGIVDVILQDEKKYLIMDYLEGMTLEQMIRSGKRITWKQRIDWAIQLCELLKYLHGPGKRIIYQDMKPSNIMIHVSGSVKILDFGISDVENKEDRGSGYGTKGFAAPEQYQGKADEQTDIYGLGAVMKYMEPFRIKKKVPLREWQKIYRKCMETNRKKRYLTAVSVEKDLLFLKYRLEGRRKVYAGTVLAAIGLLFLLAGWMKKRELLMDAGGLLAGNTEKELSDAADYEEAKQYFLKKQLVSEEGSLYRVILEAIEKEEDSLWKQARTAMEKLEEKENGSWKQVRENVFLSNVYIAYGKELGFTGKENLRRAIRLLDISQEEIRKNNTEVLADIYRIEILCQKAKCYAWLEETDKGIICYESLLDEKLPGETECDVRISLAALYRKKQKYDLAKVCYEEIINKYPAYGEAYCAYALMLAMEENKMEEAQNILDAMDVAGADTCSFNSEIVKRKIRELEDDR